MVTIDKITADIEDTASKMNDARDSYEPGAVNIERLVGLQAEVRGYIHTLIRTKDCSAVLPITSHRGGLIGALDVFAKRVIRKMTLWLIEPAWKQQKSYNNALMSATARMADINEELIEVLVAMSRDPSGGDKNP